ncbi:hypothetical protein [Glaciibacter sp. 2TAF33]|uniref:hypothetical protein n=1 Tax=Glaciibacter sp. 2TAF33 TaxID=3233015 RepID=UPI003F8EAE1D
MSNVHDSHGPARYARHYVPERPVRRMRPVDPHVLRQALAGGAVVVVVNLVTGTLSFLGGLGWGLGTFAAAQLGFEAGSALLFAAVAALTVLYVMPLGRALGTGSVLSRVALGGGIAAVFLAAAMIAWTLLVTGGMPGNDLISSGILQPIATGLVNTALFALGVLIIRSLPDQPCDEPSAAPVPSRTA